jgi:hypothetical protein
MRLYELIDFSPKQSKIGAYDNKQRVQNKTQSRIVGDGAFGTAYDTRSNKRLNQVTKIGRTGAAMTGQPAKEIGQDGWLSYMHAVHSAQQRGDQNPYFPVMDDLRIRKDAKGNLTYTANLHKLIPFMAPKIASNTELMKSTYERMFGEECPSKDWADILDSITANLQLSRSLSDPDLKNAMNLIDSIVDRSYKGELMKDIHTGNVMWRLTGTMPHLVIVDPIA